MAISFPNDNFEYLIGRSGRFGIMQCYVQGFPDVICTKAPAVDAKEMAQSLEFDGVNDTLSSANVNDLIESGDFTALIWVKPTRSGSVEFILSWIENSGSLGWSITIGTTGQIGLLVNSTTVNSGATVVAAVDKWNLIGVSLGGIVGLEVRFMVWTIEADGSVTRSSIHVSADGPDRSDRELWAATPQVNDPIRVGHLDTAWFEGFATLPQIWDRAFTFSEMERMAYRIIDAKWAGFWDDLQGQWAIQEGAGDTIANSAASGSARNLTRGASTAAPAWSEDAPFTITYREVMTPTSAIGQDIEPRATRTQISGLSFRVLDSSGWLTAELARHDLAVRNKSAYIFLGFEGLLEDEYQVIFSGSVEAIDPIPGRGYEMRIADAQRFTKVAFPLGKVKLAANATDSATTLTVDSVYGLRALTTAEVADAQTIRGYVKIDDEIIEYSGVQTGPLRLTVAFRAMFGTTAAAHLSGAQVREIFVLGVAANPITALLELLLSSTGNGCCHATYDTQAVYADATDPTETQGRGVGMSLADVDVAAFEAFRTAHVSTWDSQPVITESIDDLKAWIEEQFLRVMGAFFFVRADGRLSIGSWAAPASNAATISMGDQARPDQQIDYSKVVNRIEVAYDYDLVEDRYDGVIAVDDADSIRAHGASPILRIESRWIRTANVDGLAFNPTPATIIAAFTATILDRFKHPQQLVRTTVSLDHMIYEMADGVLYQQSDLADLTAGERGLMGVDTQIVGRTFDAKRARILLTLMRVPE